MSAADGLAWNEEDGSAILSTLTISASETINKTKSMKPVMRYQSQLLFRKSYKPDRMLRIRPVPKLKYNFRPRTAGLKPEIQIVS